MKQTKILHHANGRLTKKRGPAKISHDAKICHADLASLGVCVKNMDSALLGGGAAGVPGYLPRDVLTTWLGGTLRTITQVRNIDRIAGESTVGKWEDEAIKLMVETPAGQPELYGDNTNIPLADIRHTVESRGIVRFELGFRVGDIEGKRLSAANIDAAASKRRAVTEALDVSRNAIGFYGYNSADANVYGLLNDPGLPAYQVRNSNGFSNIQWSGAPTFDSVTKDIAAMFKTIVSQSGGHVQKDAALCLVIPTKHLDILDIMHPTTATTVGEWITKNYPNMRVENTPEFDSAQSVGVAYMFVENAGQFDDSDTLGATLIHAVPTRFKVLGSDTEIKGYIEDCVNATAGVFVLRPWAFCRYDLA